MLQGHGVQVEAIAEQQRGDDRLRLRQRRAVAQQIFQPGTQVLPQTGRSVGVAGDVRISHIAPAPQTPEYALRLPPQTEIGHAGVAESPGRAYPQRHFHLLPHAGTRQRLFPCPDGQTGQRSGGVVSGGTHRAEEDAQTAIRQSPHVGDCADHANGRRVVRDLRPLRRRVGTVGVEEHRRSPSRAADKQGRQQTRRTAQATVGQNKQQQGRQ